MNNFLGAYIELWAGRVLGIALAFLVAVFLLGVLAGEGCRVAYRYEVKVVPKENTTAGTTATKFPIGSPIGCEESAAPSFLQSAKEVELIPNDARPETECQ